MDDETRVVSAERVIAAPAGVIFELIADPARQPEWDGNDNLLQADSGQRVRGVGDTFVMNTRKGNVRVNHVDAFEEGRIIAWRPAGVGTAPFGHRWMWELEPIDAGRTRVRHTYDWRQLTDEGRMARARWTTSERLLASIDRLAAAAERSVDDAAPDDRSTDERPADA